MTEAMSVAESSQDIKAQLHQFIERSKDGYAIFDRDEQLTYCNQRFADILNVVMEQGQAHYWDEILRANFNLGRGVKIDSGDIEAFIQYTLEVRRSRPFRLFEVDFVDGRWFLFSEQVNRNGELLMQLKEITKQKVLEDTLHQELSNLRREATTDELTRIGNRRSLIESVNSELNRCRRTGAAMSMLLFDLDHFKSVNDTHGHLAGDAALKQVALLLKSALRAYDILGRIGGEEFAIFLSNTSAEEAKEIAERIRISIAETRFSHEGAVIPLAVSVGITTLGCDALFEQLYQQADEALYQSKANGRNRTTVFAH